MEGSGSQVSVGGGGRAAAGEAAALSIRRGSPPTTLASNPIPPVRSLVR